jgi:ABC-2 type transport system ATP-binding protein
VSAATPARLGPVHDGAGAADAIDVRGLVKRYGPVQALRGIDLRVGSGEVFALLGPNGAGKTTTIEILTGARRRSGGQALVLGADPGRDARGWRARIGIVPQSLGTFADLTVAEVIGHFAAFYPAPLPTMQVLDLVGLGKQHGTRCQRLSGGQLRRVDIAVGIAGDPELIFLDEPTTGLDPQARHAIWDLVRQFAARGKTIVLTTHYLDEVTALADRAAVISAGQVITAGPLAELGGSSSGQATVSFTRSGALADTPLPTLPAGTIEDGRDGDPRVRIDTARPTEAVAALIAWAAAEGVRELPDLRIERPTLEDVYLDLIRAASDSLSVANCGLPVSHRSDEHKGQ